MSRLLILDSVDSTNDYLKREAASLPEGTVVIANEQTNGKGRLGRSFYSPPSMGIYMSMLLRPDCAPLEAATLTANAAVAVCKAIERVTPFKPDIKWINDVLLRGKKICGILCESSITDHKLDYVIVGVGLNVITRVDDFPYELLKTAGSIYSQTGEVADRGKLILAIIEELDAMYAAWQQDKTVYLEEYKSRCAMLGHEVEIYSSEGSDTVLAEDISEDFGLTVRYANGEKKTLHAGEVSIKY